MSTGQRLISLRKKRGITQEQLAEKVGVTRQTISKWELEQSVPDLNYICLLSEIFDVTTDFLIKGEIPKEDEIKVTITERHSKMKETEDVNESDIPQKRRISGMVIIGVIIVIAGIVLVTMSLGLAINNMIAGDEPYIIMVFLWGVSIILTGMELMVVRKHPYVGCLFAVLSVMCIMSFSFIVPGMANLLEAKRIENQPVTVPDNLVTRRIYGFNFAIYNITYIVNCIIVMIQGLIIGFKKHNLYNIVLTVLASVGMIYVILFGKWIDFSNLVPGIVFLGVSIFLTVNYHINKS